jgi:hypothetical protein
MFSALDWLPTFVEIAAAPKGDGLEKLNFNFGFGVKAGECSQLIVGGVIESLVKGALVPRHYMLVFDPPPDALEIQSPEFGCSSDLSFLTFSSA